MKAQSPQLGYNHNIPHRGRLYHVQTEDSGLDKAHIFTHVFYDGTIIASLKTEYRDRLNEPELSPLIIGLMQGSHKAIIRSLRNGEYDDKIERTIGPHPVEDNRELTELPADNAVQRPERREPPEPRDVEPQGPPLTPGRPGPTVDPGLTHPVFAAAEARAQVAAAAAGHGQSRPSPGPSRIKRRAVGGIGGAGVKVGTPITQRRDIIVGKYASEHQAQLDEEILALLRDEV
jgi:hypothetical protein